jgi:hypothetical protein
MTCDKDPGSLAAPYSTLPLRERASVTHAQGPSELRSATRLPLTTTVPDHLVAFARLLAPRLGVTVAENVPSSTIRTVMRASQSASGSRSEHSAAVLQRWSR